MDWLGPAQTPEESESERGHFQEATSKLTTDSEMSALSLLNAATPAFTAPHLPAAAHVRVTMQQEEWWDRELTSECAVGRPHRQLCTRYEAAGSAALSDDKHQI